MIIVSRLSNRGFAEREKSGSAVEVEKVEEG
jgi:hypothetical protein